jgi:hypothetical protein
MTAPALDDDLRFATSGDFGFESWFGIAGVERMPSFSRMLRSSLIRGDSGKRSRLIVPRSSSIS